MRNKYGGEKGERFGPTLAADVLRAWVEVRKKLHRPDRKHPWKTWKPTRPTGTELVRSAVGGSSNEL